MAKKDKVFLNEATKEDQLKQIDKFVSNEYGPRSKTSFDQTKEFENQKKIHKMAEENELKEISLKHNK